MNGDKKMWRVVLFFSKRKSHKSKKFICERMSLAVNLKKSDVLNENLYTSPFDEGPDFSGLTSNFVLEKTSFLLKGEKNDKTRLH